MFKNSNVDLVLCVGSSILVLLAVSLLAIYPVQANDLINDVFVFITKIVGIPLLWICFFSLVYCIYIGIRYGHIRLGKETPEYSLFNYISMVMCAGLGSAFVIWSLVEWVYYYTSPPLGIESRSIEAAEWATVYNYFHWGFIPWAMFLLATIPVSYAFYIRKVPALRLSTVCAAMLGDRPSTRVIEKIIEFTFIFSVVGGLSVTLGLGIPMIAEGIAHLFGFKATFMTNIFTTLGIAMIFTMSSYIGIGKGMRILSAANIYFAIFCLALIFIIGPTYFIMGQITNGFGLMMQNFLRISFNTDPIAQGGFPEAWTIFFYSLGIVYAGLMALFITKISRGRTLGTMIFTVLIAGSAGCFLFFGINGAFSMDLFLSGKVDVVSLLLSEGNGQTVIAILETIHFPKLAVVGFIVLISLFLTTSLDSAAFSLSAATTVKLGNDDNTSKTLRLFWCVLLTLIPTGMTFIEAPLTSLQTVAILASLPLLVVMIYMNYGFLKWLKEDGY